MLTLTKDGVSVKLSLETLQSELEKVTYKPGWVFTIYEHPYEWYWIEIRVNLVDVTDSEQITQLNIESPLPPFQNLSQFHEWMLWRLRRIETQEAQEWYRINGKPYSDPHEHNANAMGQVM